MTRRDAGLTDRAGRIRLRFRNATVTAPSMSNLTLKGIPEALHERLRTEAEANRRSLNGEVIHRLEQSLEDTPAPSMVHEGRAAYPTRSTSPAPVDEPMSLADYIALPEDDFFRVELAAGRLVREPAPGFRHGRIASRLARLLWKATGDSDLGEIFFDTGFQLVAEPPTVRIPDVAFMSATRLAEHETDKVFFTTAPDLVAEVLSPSNSASEMQRKVVEYLDAGAHLVWVIDPETETVTVYRGRDDIRVLEAEEVLDGSAVVPGLEVEVDALFG